MILVTGGAGYIGSHTLHQLVEAKLPCITIDNLYSGHRWAVPASVPFFEGSSGDATFVADIIKKHQVTSVIHFAAHLEVEESTKDPMKYYRNNFLNSMSLLDVCTKTGVKHFIFSSTCAIYGTPDHNPVSEDFPKAPISPYGKSKLATEWLLEDLVNSGTTTLRYVSLRYFNVAGAKVNGGLGQATPRATQLVKVACEAALGKRDKMVLYGTDYPTADGTCVRDYIHIDDLAELHLLSLKYLENGGKSEAFNCGYGKGYSVKEVIESVKRASGTNFKVETVGRRQGDSIEIYADPTKVIKALSWKPRYADLDLICRTSLEWEKNRPK